MAIIPEWFNTGTSKVIKCQVPSSALSKRPSDVSPNAVGLAILSIQQQDITRPLEERGLFPYMCIFFKVGKYFWRFPNSYQAFRQDLLARTARYAYSSLITKHGQELNYHIHHTQYYSPSREFGKGNSHRMERGDIL